MKLIKFHIGNSTTRSPCHSNTVSGRSIRISRVEINLACSSCGKDGVCRLKYLDFPVDFIEDIGPSAAILPCCVSTFCQINGDFIFKQINIWMVKSFLRQYFNDGFASSVGYVEDPSLGPASTPV